MMPFIYDTLCQPILNQFSFLYNSCLTRITTTIENLTEDQIAMISAIALSAIGLCAALYAGHVVYSTLFIVSCGLEIYFSSSVFNYQTLFNECVSLKAEIKDREELQKKLESTTNELTSCSQSATACTLKIESLEKKLVTLDAVQAQMKSLEAKLEAFETVHAHLKDLAEWAINERSEKDRLSHQLELLTHQLGSQQNGLSSLDTATEKLGLATQKIEGLSTLANQLSAGILRLEQLEERLSSTQNQK